MAKLLEDWGISLSWSGLNSHWRIRFIAWAYLWILAYAITAISWTVGTAYSYNAVITSSLDYYLSKCSSQGIVRGIISAQCWIYVLAAYLFLNIIQSAGSYFQSPEWVEARVLKGLPHLIFSRRVSWDLPHKPCSLVPSEVRQVATRYGAFSVVVPDMYNVLSLEVFLVPMLFSLKYQEETFLISWAFN